MKNMFPGLLVPPTEDGGTIDENGTKPQLVMDTVNRCMMSDEKFSEFVMLASFITVW